VRRRAHGGGHEGGARPRGPPRDRAFKAGDSGDVAEGDKGQVVGYLAAALSADRE
jgi:hypothetical protein